ncbi:hypothetical protein LVR63_29430, partial [Pseudomonas aeruginosa]|uniref:hypothetical protein n=1 Tax=Pseudomonas aeruginosa TaxID=287 RepID=UPI0020954959
LDASTDGLRFVGIVLLLLALVVMPLDGKEHARAKHQHLERNKDYWDPIHLGNLTLLIVRSSPSKRCSRSL